MSATPATESNSIPALDGAASAIASARRATVAARYAANSLSVEWRSLGELLSVEEEWRELATRALEPNVFYEPAFALEAAAVFGASAGAVLVWSGTAPRKLLGFFPARIEPRRYGINLPVLVGWTHPYAPLGTPLVEREAAEPVIAAWLAHVADNKALPGVVLLPYVQSVSPFAAELHTILQRGRISAADLNIHERAMLAPRGDRTLYVERTLDQRKHKEMRRLVRRLGDTGALLFTTATEPEAIAKAIEDFFELEVRGWKGEAGSAAAFHDDVRRFMKNAVVNLAAQGRAAINRIFIDGRAIAAAITLRSGDTAWFWKIAYDESFAQFSPGVVLTLAVTEDLVEDSTLLRTDSCATANHPMINHIWRERLDLADRLIGVRSNAGFTSVYAMERLRSLSASAAKGVRDWFHQ
jgi:CelD/BcsL family acetyltransferase involved in cellulose biosynthesis